MNLLTDMWYVEINVITRPLILKWLKDKFCVEEYNNLNSSCFNYFLYPNVQKTGGFWNGNHLICSGDLRKYPEYELISSSEFELLIKSSEFQPLIC